MKYFVFGTLFDEDILAALIERIPKNCEAVLHGYGVFLGDSKSLNEDLKKDIGSKRDLSTFSFLFAKKSTQNEEIKGKIVELEHNEENFFDAWERCPKWYQKEKATATDSEGVKHEVCVYVQNIDGKRLNSFERIQGDKKSYVDAAKRLHEKLIS
ncbi:MAG: gamma-glutamylcyclotransferase family protein [Patescibacteria group bacterium]